jgi:hypothetical protein
LQENLRDLVSLGILYLIGDWRKFSMSKLAILDSEFDECLFSKLYLICNSGCSITGFRCRRTCYCKY